MDGRWASGAALASANLPPSATFRGSLWRGGGLTITSVKMSLAYSRSPCSPSALSASSSPGGAHGPGGLSRSLGEALLPEGTSSGTGALAGSESREAAGICWGEGPGSDPGRAGSETPAPAAHQHPSGWRWGRNREPTSSRWSQDRRTVL